MAVVPFDKLAIYNSILVIGITSYVASIEFQFSLYINRNIKEVN